MADEQQMKDLIGKGCTCQFFDAGRVDGKLTFNRIACERTCPVHDITDYQRGLEDAARLIQEEAAKIHRCHAHPLMEKCLPLNEAARLDSYAHRIRALADKPTDHSAR